MTTDRPTAEDWQRAGKMVGDSLENYERVRARDERLAATSVPLIDHWAQDRVRAEAQEKAEFRWRDELGAYSSRVHDRAFAIIALDPNIRGDYLIETPLLHEGFVGGAQAALINYQTEAGEVRIELKGSLRQDYFPIDIAVSFWDGGILNRTELFSIRRADIVNKLSGRIVTPIDLHNLETILGMFDGRDEYYPGLDAGEQPLPEIAQDIDVIDMSLEQPWV